MHTGECTTWSKRFRGNLEDSEGVDSFQMRVLLYLQTLLFSPHDETHLLSLMT